MRVLIVSDTHGRHTSLDRALKEAGEIDMFIHLGDVEGGEADNCPVRSPVHKMPEKAHTPYSLLFLSAFLPILSVIQEIKIHWTPALKLHPLKIPVSHCNDIFPDAFHLYKNCASSPAPAMKNPETHILSFFPALLNFSSYFSLYLKLFVPA